VEAIESRRRSPDTVSDESSSSATEPADGEYGVLLKSLEEESAPLTPLVAQQLMKKTLSGTRILDDASGLYRKPLSEEEALVRMPKSEGGQTWYAEIIPDEFFVEGRLKKGLKHRDFDVEHQAIKPRRPSLPITASDFFSSLTKIEGSQPRYIFYVREKKTLSRS